MRPLDIVGRILRRVLFQRYVVEWEWPHSSEPATGWEPETVYCRGLRLATLYGRGKEPVQGVVVCVPPTTRASKGYFLTRGYGAALRGAGYDVVLLDLNGFGESPYRSIDYDADILAVGHAAARKRPGLPVGLFGVCLGASYGICAMTLPAHPFRAAVLESPYSSIRDVLKAMDRHVSRTRAYRRGARLIPFLAPFFQRFNMVRRARRVVDVERVLFIACGRDAIVPPESVRIIARELRASPSPAARTCSVWEVPNAEHLRAVEASPDDYFERVVGFFDGALAREPTPKAPRAA